MKRNEHRTACPALVYSVTLPLWQTFHSAIYIEQTPLQERFRFLQPQVFQGGRFGVYEHTFHEALKM